MRHVKVIVKKYDIPERLKNKNNNIKKNEHVILNLSGRGDK